MVIGTLAYKGRDIRAALTLTGEGWDTLHPEVKRRALLVLDDAQRAGLVVGVFEGRRSAARQAELIKAGASKVSDPDSSYHRWGLAVDFVFLDRLGRWTWDAPREDWNKLGAIIRKHGFTWGGDFASIFDGPHAELRLFTIAQLKAGGTPEKKEWA